MCARTPVMFYAVQAQRELHCRERYGMRPPCQESTRLQRALQHVLRVTARNTCVRRVLLPLTAVTANDTVAGPRRMQQLRRRSARDDSQSLHGSVYHMCAGCGNANYPCSPVSQEASLEASCLCRFACCSRLTSAPPAARRRAPRAAQAQQCRSVSAGCCANKQCIAPHLEHIGRRHDADGQPVVAYHPQVMHAAQVEQRQGLRRKARSEQAAECCQRSASAPLRKWCCRARCRAAPPPPAAPAPPQRRAPRGPPSRPRPAARRRRPRPRRWRRFAPAGTP